MVSKGDILKFQSDAIWGIHTNMYRIMLLFYFRMVAIDMTLFQFIDWFLEQFEEEELNEELDDIKQFEKLTEELNKAETSEAKAEITKRLIEMNCKSKSSAAEAFESADNSAASSTENKEESQT